MFLLRPFIPKLSLPTTKSEEKPKAKSEKAKSARRKVKSQKPKAKSEKRKTKSEKQKAKTGICNLKFSQYLEFRGELRIHKD